MKKYRSIICIVLFIACQMVSFAQTQYYPQHFVIVVDQGAVQGHINMPEIYQKLKDYFINGKNIFNDNCEFPTFNPNTDQISIFASSIYGQNYKNIFNGCSLQSQKYSEDKITNILTNSLFHERTDYQTFASNGDLTTFLSNNLEPLLLNRSWKKENIHAGDKVIGLNGYLYPLIINKITSTTPAEKYYFFIISNFAQQGSERDTDDAQLKPLLGIRPESQTYKYWNAFQKDISQLECDFYRNPHPSFFSIPINHPTPANNKNNPKIDFFGLKISKLEQASAILTQQPTFQQLKLHGKDFQCNPTIISFNHPENMQIIDCWENIETNDTTIIRQYKLNENVRQQKQGEAITYIIGEQNFALGQLKPDDKIVCTYHFYTSITNQQGDTLLPMVFSTQPNTYTLRKSDFIPEPISLFSTTNIILCLLLLIIIIGFLVYFWHRRAKKATASIDFHFDPVSQEKYMNVSNMKVKEYDCWYLNPEEDNIKIQIQVKGHITYIKPKFARDTYRFRVEFKIDDIDHDDYFTFLPVGDDNNGNPYKLSEWYLVEPDANGDFTISIISYLDIERHPELNQITDEFWNEDHVLSTQIQFRAYAVNKENEKLLMVKHRDSEVTEKEIWPEHQQKTYTYIARPTFELRDSWIAFDPGTTGACAAFITGGNIDENNIHVVTEEVERSGAYYIEAIFPSKIWITDYAQAFETRLNGQEITDVQSWIEGKNTKDHKDFIFGWEADRMISRNSFQSIKKLLGYTTPQTIISGSIERYITGQKLAQLLVKGLYNHTRRYITKQSIDGSNDEQTDIKNHYFDSQGNFNPKKAIVAVPNNYTLPKIQEMVDTIKALHQFKEVHFIYESEGVLMEYCHQNWHKLDQKQNKILLVFDMGGATINVTAFKLSRVIKDNHNNITDITIETIGKIGYCVGGDDIDYAIIRQIYELSAIKNQFTNDQEILNHMAKHKQLLIKLARELKMSIIALHNGQQTSILNSEESFDTHINSYAKDLGWQEDMKFKTEDYRIWLNTQRICECQIFQDFIYLKVEDAVKELYATLNFDDKYLPIEIIYSGRSTLFPYICNKVENALPHKKYDIWLGLVKDGKLDADAVKTAVVTGACWYANFSRHITIRHNIITSSFGYLDHDNGKEIFVPMITTKDKFENGVVKKEKKPLSPALLQEVIFVQMQGADFQKILSDFRTSCENKHKMNILDKVKPGSNVNDISIKLDERFNFRYDIHATNSADTINPGNYPLSRLNQGTNIKMEISDENNESYMFAATSTKEETIAQQEVIKRSSTNTKKHF